MKKVLIIGGTGTISTPVMEGLASDPDVDLYVLNRGNKSQMLPENVHHLIGDIRNEQEKVKDLVKDLSFDSVINFVLMSVEDARINYEIWKDKTKQFIFISTVVVLDHYLTCNIDELAKTGNSISTYGQSKAECEQYLMDKYENESFPLTIVRPTQTYSDERIPLSVKGKNCWSVVSRMLRGKEVIIHGDGQSVWASTHASDFARMFLPVVANDQTVGEIYQIMNPKTHTWDMIYSKLAELLNVEYKPVYISSYLLSDSKTYNLKESILGDKLFSNIFDISKIKYLSSDFTCEVSLEKGLEMYLEYMDAHPEKKSEDEAFDIWCDQSVEAYKECMRLFKTKLK